jgi:hypothetical protein
MVWLFIELYLIEGETIIIYYGRVLNCQFKEISNNLLFFSYIFTLTAWKIAIRKDQHRLILKVKNPVKISI